MCGGQHIARCAADRKSNRHLVALSARNCERHSGVFTPLHGRRSAYVAAAA